MRIARYLWLIVIVIGLSEGLCQNTIGLPEVLKYSRESYNAGLQNWDIQQDKYGTMYFANNEGLLIFDGIQWQTYPLPNKTIVRSIYIATDNNIYAGGQDEIGYFTPTTNGQLEFKSLTHLISSQNKTFGDVWEIVEMPNGIYFRSQKNIFKYANNAITIYPANSLWTFMAECNKKLYAADRDKGLLQFNGESWVSILSNNLIPDNDQPTALLSINPDSMLLTTLKNGIFSITKQGILPLSNPNNVLFKKERIYAATMVNDNLVALATNNNGAYIIDYKGNIIQHISKTEGLQNNNILSIFKDNEQNLWLGLDNGIDYVAYNHAIKQIIPSYQQGPGYTALIHNNHLYTGTSNGLYEVPLQNSADLSFSIGSFKMVSNTAGQTWTLANINNQLLLGHHEGAFTIKKGNAIPFSTTPGFWTFASLDLTGQLIAGQYQGISIFNTTENSFISAGNIEGFSESSRYLTVDNQQNIWVSHPYHGIFKLTKNPTGNYNIKDYTTKNGLPANLNNHVYAVKGSILVGTENGVYTYNNKTDRFEVDNLYKKLLGNLSVRYLKQDKEDNVWFIHAKSIGVIDFTAKQPKVIRIPELTNKMLSGFEFIYPIDSLNIFLGAEKGFFHINYKKYKNSNATIIAKLRSVKIISSTDSLLFGGYFKPINDLQQQTKTEIKSISHLWKSIRFEYASNTYGNTKNIEYSYQLKGFDEGWSDWTTRTEKEYSISSAGTYTFLLKVKNNLGIESEISAYTFKILPPWYFTTWAYLAYTILIVLVMYKYNRWQKKKFEAQRIAYEAEQKRQKYVHDLEISKAESELVALGNDKLKSEIAYKNAELASSAMHLVGKSELIGKLKQELTTIMKGLKDPQATNDIKKMVKVLGADDHIDNEWETFTQHFNTVHSDYLIKLKEQHANITPNELKLCAYLRMNLSTKEIAQLMKISTRGVEISRYRLRKKLGITTEINLFDYLISIK